VVGHPYSNCHTSFSIARHKHSRRYYFPFGGTKRIPFADIESVQFESTGLLASKGWGLGFSKVLSIYLCCVANIVF
jgi:hypothetical protein